MVDTETLLSLLFTKQVQSKEGAGRYHGGKKRSGHLYLSYFFLSWYLSRGCVIAQVVALVAGLQESHLFPHWPSCPGVLKDCLLYTSDAADECVNV